MTRPSLGFLCDCIAAALLARYGVTRPPVPLRAMLGAPPPDLARHISLTETLPFGDALWLRPPGGQASIFVNPAIPEPNKRYGMARAMFVGLCSSQGGQAAGLPEVPNDNLSAQSDLFARRLLLAPSLMPDDWEELPVETLAELFGVPTEVVEAHLGEMVRGDRAPLDAARADGTQAATASQAEARGV
jgi:hypothetical protein